MRVTVVRGGGLAGLLTVSSLDDADLDPSDAQVMRSRAAAADVFRQPERVPGSRSAVAQPDRFSYEITVDDGERQHRIQRRETELTPELQALVRMVQAAPERSSRVVPPGAGPA